MAWYSGGTTPPSSGPPYGVFTVAMTAASQVIQKSIVQANTAETAVASSMILLKIFQNILKDDSNIERRRLRLSNKTIAKNIVNVKGPLDLLGLVGFEKDGSDFIVLRTSAAAAPAGTTKDELSLLSLCDEQIDLMQSCCLELEQVVTDLERGMKQVQGKKSPPVATGNSLTGSSNASTTLSEEEYKARLERIARVKAEKKKEKEAALRIWNENAQGRKEMQERKEAAKRRMALADDDRTLVPLGVTIRTQKDHSAARLPKPFEPTRQENQDVLIAAAAARAERAEKEIKMELERPKSRLLLDETFQTLKPAPSSAVKNSGVICSGNDLDASKQATTKSSLKEVNLSQSIPMEEESSLFATASPTSTRNEEEWQDFRSKCSHCAPAEGIRATSYYNTSSQQGSGAYNTSASSKCLKRLLLELQNLENDLPSDRRASIWIRFEEEHPQFLRVLMAAPLPGPTPYTGGLFVFDVYIPSDYPQEPPKVILLTTGGGSVRFGPNLYANGKVCLSLLGTWNGPKWSPKHSTLLQVLISIQGLVLGVEHPYYLEPGHGGWEGKVQEGIFRMTGHTLAGETVKQEVGLPMNVILFEDKIRVGTVKYAMLESLEVVFDQAKASNRWIQPFRDIIQAHFYCNKEEILTEVRTWTSDAMLGRQRDKVMSDDASGIFPIDCVTSVLLPKLEKLLLVIQMPTLEGISASAHIPGAVDSPGAAAAVVSMTTKIGFDSIAELQDMKMPAKRISDTAASDSTPKKEQILTSKRAKIQTAAQHGDFEQNIDRLEQLEASMKEAAEAGDFIRAGNLQQQLKALTVEDQSSNESVAPPGLGGDIELESHSESENESDSESDEGFPEDDGFNPEGGLGGGAGHGGGFAIAGNIQGLGKNVFAPPGWNAKHAKGPSNHNWGGGKQLGNSTQKNLTSSVAAASSIHFASGQKSDLKKKRSKVIAHERLCRLRIRLPNDKSIIEDFDLDEPLSAVYTSLISVLEPENDGNTGDREKALLGASPPTHSGAFARPLSSAGFTLLLTRPKREFSLEMHGTKSLESLNLVPSATLTVMKCTQRGMMMRGELESRLDGAQGDAMDVDGLTYEGLVELTERVGGAAPTEGTPFISLTEKEFDQNSEAIAPSDYINCLDDSDGEDARRCPICLGTYDVSDTTYSIRKLNHCQHHFHTACLATWLVNKSSCPLCKCSIRPES